MYQSQIMAQEFQNHYPEWPSHKSRWPNGSYCLYMLAKGSLANLRAKLQHVLESDCQNVLVFATFASLSNKGRLLLVTLQ